MAMNATFLICDNNVWVARLTKWRLQTLFGAGITVILGHSGEDAINLFQELVRNNQHTYLQLILLGCHMPVYTGMQAVAEIRSIEQKNSISRAVEIIGTTTDLNDEVYLEFMQAGANIVLAKPVPEGELEEVCLEIVSRKENS